MDAHNCLKTVC